LLCSLRPAPWRRARRRACPKAPADPATEKFQGWPIPSGGAYSGIVRHMSVTREGNLLIHQSSTARIILVTPVRSTASLR
jgi:hypothetical protein